jgi:hypothetical protein
MEQTRPINLNIINLFYIFTYSLMDPTQPKKIK